MLIRIGTNVFNVDHIVHMDINCDFAVELSVIRENYLIEACVRIDTTQGKFYYFNETAKDIIFWLNNFDIVQHKIQIVSDNDALQLGDFRIESDLELQAQDDFEPDGKPLDKNDLSGEDLDIPWS